MSFYLRNFENGKYLYFDDEVCEEVDRASFAESIESVSIAKIIIKVYKNQFPHLEIVDKHGCLV